MLDNGVIKNLEAIKTEADEIFLNILQFITNPKEAGNVTLLRSADGIKMRISDKISSISQEIETSLQALKKQL